MTCAWIPTAVSRARRYRRSTKVFLNAFIRSGHVGFRRRPVSSLGIPGLAMYPHLARVTFSKSTNSPRNRSDKKRVLQYTMQYTATSNAIFDKDRSRAPPASISGDFPSPPLLQLPTGMHCAEYSPDSRYPSPQNSIRARPRQCRNRGPRNHPALG